VEKPIEHLDLSAMLTGSVKRIAYVNRYSSLPVVRHENVAEHTCFVALFCLLIGKDVVLRGFNVDFEKLLKSALLHDIDESLSGDFLRCVKYGVPGLKELLNQAGLGFMRSIEQQLHVELISDWSEVKDGTLEGNILAIADLLGVVSYIFEQFGAGNRHLLYILKEVDRYFEQLEVTLQSVLIRYVSETRSMIDAVYKKHRDSTVPTLKEPTNAFSA